MIIEGSITYTPKEKNVTLVEVQERVASLFKAKPKNLIIRSIGPTSVERISSMESSHDSLVESGEYRIQFAAVLDDWRQEKQ